MKKIQCIKLLIAILFGFCIISCNTGIREEKQTDIEETDDELISDTPKIPQGFVKIEGTTIVGGDKFASDKNSMYWKGVFIEGRTVILTDFYLCDHEVTQKEYEEIIGLNPSVFKENPSEGEKQEKRPVENVSWYDTIVYCNYLSLKEGLEPCYSLNGESDPAKWGEVPKVYDRTWNYIDCDFSKEGYRLPTEAEWEYAARGGMNGVEKEEQNRWSGTNDISLVEDFAWFDSNSNLKTHEVKLKKPNELGLFDMSGNVFEWTWDAGNDYIPQEIVKNPTGHSDRNMDRVYKGAYWEQPKDRFTIAFRGFAATKDKVYFSSSIISGSSVGFRVARTCK